MSNEPTMLANEVEWKFAVAHRRYERVKLVIVSITLVVLLFMGAILISGQAEARRTRDRSVETLVLIRCAVDPRIQVRPDGTKRTDEEKRAEFDKCVKRALK